MEDKYDFSTKPGLWDRGFMQPVLFAITLAALLPLLAICLVFRLYEYALGAFERLKDAALLALLLLVGDEEERR